MVVGVRKKDLLSSNKVKKGLGDTYQNGSCSKKSILLLFLEFIAMKFSKNFDVCKSLCPLTFFTPPFAKFITTKLEFESLYPWKFLLLR